MERKNVRWPARPCWLAGASVFAGTLLASACGSASPAATSASSASASGASSAAVAPASIAPDTSAASAPAEPTPAAATTSPAAINPGGTKAGGTSAATQTCAYRAAHDAYIYITKVAPTASGALTITGQDAKLVCGGPDDFHWNTVTTAETVHTVPAVSISVFPTTTMAPRPIKPSQLAAYLKTDGDTKIFLVGGPLSAITSLQEQFHP